MASSLATVYFFDGVFLSSGIYTFFFFLFFLFYARACARFRTVWAVFEFASYFRSLILAGRYRFQRDGFLIKRMVSIDKNVLYREPLLVATQISFPFFSLMVGLAYVVVIIPLTLASFLSTIDFLVIDRFKRSTFHRFEKNFHIR